MLTGFTLPAVSAPVRVQEAWSSRHGRPGGPAGGCIWWPARGSVPG